MRFSLSCRGGEHCQRLVDAVKQEVLGELGFSHCGCLVGVDENEM
jgi:hypothetical protein